MTRTFFAILIHACLATSLWAHEGDTAFESAAGLFESGTLVEGPKLVSCTLSGGTETTCSQITVLPEPTDHEMGPWCPRSTSDTAEDAGVWLEGGAVYDADGPFVENLAEFYEDDEWQLFDPSTGAVRVTDSKTSCEAAARPDVSLEYNNYCVECQTSYMEDDIRVTYVIPLEPVPMAAGERRPFSGFGVAFNGVKLEAPAPTDAILRANTLAPFDDCGGHVNLHVGYHYHAVMGCSREVPSTEGHAPQIGIAMDGYPILARFDAEGSAASGLDECGGHEVAGLGYHYHVNEPGANQILGCLRGEAGCALTDDGETCDASRRPGPPGGLPPRPGGQGTGR